MAALNPDSEADSPLIGGVTDSKGLFQSLEHPVDQLPPELIPVARHAHQMLARYEAPDTPTVDP